MDSGSIFSTEDDDSYMAPNSEGYESTVSSYMAAAVGGTSGTPSFLSVPWYVWLGGTVLVLFCLYLIWAKSLEVQNQVELGARYNLSSRRATLATVDTLPHGHIPSENDRAPKLRP